MNGNIFDIQRFSLHDGPGLRTTVFFKGCPLRCMWCHNPESMDIRPQLRYKEKNCTNCLACVSACPNSVHQAIDNIHTVDFIKCKTADYCEAVCNFGALSIIGKQMSIEEIMTEIIKDKAYYDNSGGGITLSGGEPTLQTPFLLELLKQIKKEDIHASIETCGYSNQENLNKLVPLVDLFLFDYKATGEELHKTLTGVGQEVILSNLDFLINQGANVILRCPMIPGVNDQDIHLKAIALLSQKYPSLNAVEVLPYHDYGLGKWAEVGKEYSLPEIPSVDNQQLDHWKNKLLEYGCLHLI